jgi:Tyrosine phosphatase family
MNSTSRSFARSGENPAGRHLDWDGCFNARDLGGIPLVGGGETRWGAVIRADNIDALSPSGKLVTRVGQLLLLTSSSSRRPSTPAAKQHAATP